jgi:3-oxoacyl-[acyl-carrier-protein] synthase II
MTDAPLVTGIGIVSPLGIGREAVARALRESRSGVAELTLAEPLGGCEHAAEVGDYDWQAHLLSVQTYADRATQLALGAARMALEDAGLAVPVPAEAEPVGLVYATGWGCLDAAEAFYEPVAQGRGRSARSLVFSHSYPNSPTSLVAVELGLRGYSTSWAGAPGAGGWALRSASDALATGAAARVLVGASDALSAPRLASLDADGVLPRTGELAPPADASGEAPWRDVPGEAAVFLLLESPESASRRGAVPLGTLAVPVDAAEAVAEDADPARPVPGTGRTGAAEDLLRVAAVFLSGEGTPRTLRAGEGGGACVLRCGFA